MEGSKSWSEANSRAISLSEPCFSGIVEISSRVPDAYNQNDGDYKHVTLRATCDIPHPMTLFRETPVAYAPSVSFTPDESFQSTKTPGKRIELGDFSVKPLDDAEILESVREKEAFFRQGWPAQSPHLVGFPNAELLQLTCVFILRKNDIALECIESGRYFISPAANCSGLDKDMFVAIMKALCQYKCPKNTIMSWIKFENLSYLYNVVASNFTECTTLISNCRFGVGFYPVLCHANHSCEPNCVRIGMPNGMYLLAIKPIKKGDELTISYISNHVPHFNDPSFVLSSLEQTYGFTCACEVCRGNKIQKHNSHLRSATLGVDPRSRNPSGDSEQKEDYSRLTPNLFQQRMGHLVTETPGLTDMLNKLFDASHFSNSVIVPERIIKICEAIRVKFGHLFEKEPVLAFIVSRNYVRLLSPKNNFPIRIISDYPYWIGVFEKALLDVYPERSMFHVWCSFYQSLFKLLYTNVTLQDAYHKEVKSSSKTKKEKVKTTEEKVQITEEKVQESSVPEIDKADQQPDGLQDFVRSFVDLRLLTRSVLGSHWFLWTEFAMFTGLDVFLRFIEPNIVHYESLRYLERSSEGFSLRGNATHIVLK